MNGLLAFAGQVFLPISQMALWVLGLRDRAETEGTSEPLELEVTAAENQDFLPLGQQDLPPGAFPQLEVDFQTFDGSTNWDVSLADPTIDSPATLSSAYARKTAGAFEGEYELLVHVIVSDNNGLTKPQLEQSAMDSLTLAQSFFKGAATADISIDFISANSVQIEWMGAMANAEDRLYYPLHLDVEDRESFTQALDAQVPILSDALSF
ncbi:hypothetical protein N9O95_04990 [Alphaproteobacteria bacterium]|nr:hypothetical protein [Alphaproteobacteria bacterium]